MDLRVRLKDGKDNLTEMTRLMSAMLSGTMNNANGQTGPPRQPRKTPVPSDKWT